MYIEKDFLILGSGVAGLTFALKASQFGSVAIITKGELEESTTRYAQGGIASVMTDDDSFELHTEDTLEAGRGLCREDVVRIICREGPACVRELIGLGAEFTRIHGEDYHLSREGGHSRDRILHANDLTGKEIERTLIEAVISKDNIEIFPHHMLIDFITRARLDTKVEPGGARDEA
ncbi:MAG: FAD-binding protein, partial [Nitrospinaceae bacterium]|nr:FAD-binding protein [Nitrospinaceae bacterium]